MAGRILDELGCSFDGVCWVPVSKKRRKSRGYDQSELLAKRVAKDLSLPTCAALQKHAERNPQSQLKDAALRQANASRRVFRAARCRCFRENASFDRRYCNDRRDALGMLPDAQAGGREAYLLRGVRFSTQGKGKVTNP